MGTEGSSSPVDREQLSKAVAAVLKYLSSEHRKHNELFESTEYLYLVLGLGRLPRSRKDKPRRIPLPNHIYSKEDKDVCLFVKDHKGEGHKEAKQRLAQQQQAGIKKVVGLSKLRGKYEAFEAKRQLCDSFDLFLADERVLPSLPKLIGKSFFKKKKQPIPVRITVGDWGAMVDQALSGTYLYPAPGNCVSIKFAHSGLSQAECLENAEATLKAAAALIPGGWRNIRAVHLKSAESLALPVMQELPRHPVKSKDTPLEAGQGLGASAAADSASEQLPEAVAQATADEPTKLAKQLARKQAGRAAKGRTLASA